METRKDLLITLTALNKTSYNVVDSIIQKDKFQFCLSDVKNVNRQIEKTLYKLFALEIKEAVVDF